MRTDDEREELEARIAEDIRALKSMAAPDDELLRGYQRLIATGKVGEAREMFSRLVRVNDNIHRLEQVERGSVDIAYDERSYQSLGEAAALLVRAQQGGAV